VLKIFTKVRMLRLEKFMGKIISECQSDFIKKNITTMDGVMALMRSCMIESRR
jgi:hypothetical protein